jgi:pimeloyl-ACP methyl ester carboxylesterase
MKLLCTTWMLIRIAFVFSLVAVPALSQSRASPIHNIVLVHGAWADGSSWAKVIPLLEAKGYHVTAVQNPLTTFADDVAATNRVIDAQDGPVLLVGHSYGGAVITEAGNNPKVVGLVYVAAFAPDSGESAGSLRPGSYALGTQPSSGDTNTYARGRSGYTGNDCCVAYEAVLVCDCCQ